MRRFPGLFIACFLASLCLTSPQGFGQTVINYGDTWKYNIPSSDPGTSWRTREFVDSAWSSGPGLFGFEIASLPSPGIQTPVGSAGNQMTYLFRKTFTFNGNPANMQFAIDQVVDDGVRYYLNGNFIGSKRLNQNDAWNANATLVGDAVQELDAVVGPATGLLNGSNVLCAEVHQNGFNSSDMVFGARLRLITPPPEPEPYVPGDIQHVIFLSVDGMRGHYLQHFIETAPSEFPNFVRLRNLSAFTFNARCDYGRSVTIPNHLCMLTGRPVLQPSGLPNTTHHGFDDNGPTPGHTVHANGNSAVPYKSSVFDVVHDRGLSTSLLVDKNRLTILNISYNADAGANDLIGANNGRNKIDFVQIVDYVPATITNTLAARITGGTLENYTFMHYGVVDQAGHGSGWTNAGGSAYRNAVKTVDTHIGTILNAMEANPNFAKKIVFILSADHGGGGPGESNNHGNAASVENYTIPFFVKGSGFTPGSDIYSYFENRRNPDTGRPTYTDAAQPLRNGDAANLSTALLGLPEVPGSLMKPVLKRKFNIGKGTNSVSMTWSTYLTGYVLEYTDDLTAGDEGWTPVTTGITESNGVKSYTHTYPPPDARYFRLRQPLNYYESQ